MIKRWVFDKRIKQNMFREFAGDDFQDENSPFIYDLRKKGKLPIIGIKRNDGLYTIIGEEYVYFSSKLSIDNQILHLDFLKSLKTNAQQYGKSHKYEFIKTINGYEVWVKNNQMMNAIWNTIHLVYGDEKNY